MNLARNTLLVGLVCLSIVCAIEFTTHNFWGASTININDALGKKNIAHVAVIGSGQAGLGAAIYSARFNRHTVVIDGDEPGGLLTKTSDIDNFPGQQSIEAKLLVRNMRAQAEQFGAVFITDSVVRIEPCFPFVIHTQKGEVIYALSIIIATGAQPRRLSVPGEEAYFGAGGVSTCATCDAFFCKDKKVAVVGGGDSAVEQATQLAQYAATVTILVRKDHMRAAPPMQERLKSYPNIEVVYNVAVKEIVGDGTTINGLQLVDDNNNRRIMPIDRLFLAIGHDPKTDLVKPLVAVDWQGYIIVQGRTQHTSMQGIFAAGDNEDSLYRQAITASASGVRAAIDANIFLTDIGLTPAIVTALQPNLYTKKKEQAEIASVTTLGEFFNIVDNNQLVVAYYYSSDCPTCTKMAIGFEVVATKLSDKARFIRINTDEATGLVEEFFVYKVPSVLVFDHGNLVAHYKNFMDESQLRTFVMQFIE